MRSSTASRSQDDSVGWLAARLGLPAAFAVADVIDESVSVLKQHQAYHESDHVIARALNVYVGGSCLEELANLQHSEPVRRMLGACWVTDPTTAGDFLRRWDPPYRMKSFAGNGSGFAMRSCTSRLKSSNGVDKFGRHSWERMVP
ncbi:MAG: hypothetical protein MJE77_29020 [Proteobacteria bacterium]|nr:hypothetical protein [Pseudomonadota bacterium]